MVGTPRPDIVEDHIVMIDFEAGRRASQSRAADAEVHIIQRDRVGWIVGFRAVGLSDLEEHTGELTGPASTISPDTSTPSTAPMVMAALPDRGTSVARPRPRTTVLGLFTSIERSS